MSDEIKEFTSTNAGIDMAIRVVQPGKGMGEWNPDFDRYMSMNVSKEPLFEIYDKRKIGNNPMGAEMLTRVGLSSLQSEKNSSKLFPKEWGITDSDLEKITAWAESFDVEASVAAKKETKPDAAAPAESLSQEKSGKQGFLSRLKEAVGGTDRTKSYSNDGPSIN